MAPQIIVEIFVLLLPIWQQRPITGEDLSPSPYPLLVPAATIEFAAQGYEYGDAGMRAKLTQSLGLTQSSTATEALLAQLVAEPDELVRAAILGQLANLPLAEVDPATLVPFLAAAAPEVRAEAVRTYALVPGARAAVLLKLANDDGDPGVRLAAAQALLPLVSQLTWADLATLRGTEPRALRGCGWGASCGTSDVADFKTELRTGATGSDVVIRIAIATNLGRLPVALASVLCPVMATDDHPTVRGLAANVMGGFAEGGMLESLLVLAEDEDAEVRRLAVVALREFPAAAAGDAVVKAFADPSPFVREDAEESAVAMHDQLPMISRAADALRHSDANARYRGYHVLGRLEAADREDDVAKALPGETLARNIAAGLETLFHIGGTHYGELILGYVAHEDDGVRAAVAMALANIRSQASLDALKTLMFEPKRDVNLQAIIAAGRLENPFFAPLLLKVLRDTGMTAHFSSRERGAACWAAGRMDPPDQELAKRLLQQGTKPVIQTPMGPIFEPDYVLVSALYALTQYARADSAHRATALGVMELHGRELPAGEYTGPGQLVSTAELKEFARQARAFLDGVACEPGARPTRSMRLRYRELR